MLVSRRRKIPRRILRRIATRSTPLLALTFFFLLGASTLSAQQGRGAPKMFTTAHRFKGATDKIYRKRRGTWREAYTLRQLQVWLPTTGGRALPAEWLRQTFISCV